MNFTIVLLLLTLDWSALQIEVVRNVLDETDLNGSGFISLVEFKQLVTKSHDFKDNFRIKL